MRTLVNHVASVSNSKGDNNVMNLCACERKLQIMGCKKRRKHLATIKHGGQREHEMRHISLQPDVAVNINVNSGANSRRYGVDGPIALGVREQFVICITSPRRKSAVTYCHYYGDVAVKD
ncbi:hypothetical protein E2542_SST25849 [Spatholobus suberectus]|nr:hypothetical protein E2542_SST25849 [Spatholobus suberectus]